MHALPGGVFRGAARRGGPLTRRELGLAGLVWQSIALLRHCGCRNRKDGSQGKTCGEFHGVLLSLIFINAKEGPEFPKRGSYRSARRATPSAKFTPTEPSRERGCSATVRWEPPTSAWAPTPRPRRLSPLAPT